MICGRSELERRGRYVDLLESFLHPLHPALVQLVKRCLHNVPQQRPSTDELLATLQMMKVGMEGEYGGPMRLDMVRVRLAKEVKLRDRRIGELTQVQVTMLFCTRGNMSERADYNNIIIIITPSRVYHSVRAVCGVRT